MSAKSFASGLVLTLALGLPVRADEVRGVVSKVDPDKKELVIEGRGRAVRGQTVTFTLSPQTKIQRGGQTAKVTDLTEGKRVQVVYETRDGKRVATQVTVNPLLGNLFANAAELPPASNDPNRVTGVLRRIDLTEREIVVVGTGEKEETFRIPETVAVTRDQKAVKFDDLKEGDAVVVQVEMRDGKRAVTSVAAGTVAAQPGERPIQRLRAVLKRIDELLEQLDQRQRGERP
jgi:Cu/Ag efflux protein CusF